MEKNCDVKPCRTGEMILYQLEDTVKLEVRMEDDTVWLNRQQLALLFNRDVKTIGKHISNALHEELNGFSVVANFATTATDGKTYQVEHYNLDLVLSIGYRVKSKRGIEFRQWANKVLKDYLLKGYAINQRVERMEKKIYEHDEKIDLLIKSNLLPHEGLFFDGQIYDAFEFAGNLIKSAKTRIRLIDNYIDDTTITMMCEKNPETEVFIYTKNISPILLLAQTKFNAQYGNLSIKQFNHSHDRFLIIDDSEIFLFGASMKDLGKKWVGITKMDSSNIAPIIAKLDGCLGGIDNQIVTK